MPADALRGAPKAGQRNRRAAAKAGEINGIPESKPRTDRSPAVARQGRACKESAPSMSSFSSCHVPAGTALGSILRELLASGEASLPPCDQLDKQCWLAEVGYNSGRTGTARLPYLAVKKQFERLTDYDAVSKQFVQKRGYDRWKA